MPLTDTALRNAKPRDRDYKLTDAGGLYALVRANGSKLWQMRYRFAGKQRTLSIGAYPDVPLAQARAKRDAAKAQLRAGQDPSHAKKIERIAAEVAAATTFEAVADEWLAKLKREGKSAATISKNTWLLRGLAYPHIGKRPISALTAPELLDVLRKAERRGLFETATRQRGVFGQVFRYAIATHRVERDLSQDLRGALTFVSSKRRAALLRPEQVGPLLRDLDAYQGRGVTGFALRLAPMVFVRPIELRTAEWAEFHEADALWRLPPEKLKMRREHLVPLPRQALALLRELRPLTGLGKYLFPSVRSLARPMSENTVNAALRRLGYEKDEMTGHGFRRMASTLLNERGFNPDWIERQLAHADENEIRDIYNAAEWLSQRREMMQAWADYLDELRGASVDEIDALIG